MYAHNLPMHRLRALAPPRLAAGVFVTLALLSAACSKDPASRINSPAILSSSNIGSSADRADGSGSTLATSNFAVLANAAVTCTDGNITGDVGTFLATPPGAITLTSCPVTGATHIGDATSIAAYQAFLSTYAALAPKTTDVCPIITGTLAGRHLAPGVHCVSAEEKTGVLTLDGNGPWTIKVPTGALTGTGFSVLFAGAAQPCNVTWWVDAAATMTDSNLKGNILAGAAIGLTRGTLAGSAFAGGARPPGVGDVKITGTVVTGCASSNGKGDDDADREGRGDKDHHDKDKGHGGDKSDKNKDHGGDHGDGRGGREG
jgi:hypothetical protein